MNAKTSKIAPTSKDVVVDSGISEEMPDFLKGQTTARGSENVKNTDLIVPRIEICQSLSPARKKGDSLYIEGIEEGDFYNNVTREIYGKSVMVMPVYFRMEFLVWKDRDQGGGFRGAFPNEVAAEEAIKGHDDAEDLEAVPTSQQFVQVVLADGKTQEAVISMAKSKAKISRRWNSMIRMAGGDSFSRVYRLDSVTEKNAKNQDYYNFVPVLVGFPSRQHYESAIKMYESIKSGAKDVSRDFDDTREASLVEEGSIEF
jgi:hypothetical protein